MFFGLKFVLQSICLLNDFLGRLLWKVGQRVKKKKNKTKQKLAV